MSGYALERERPRAIPAQSVTILGVPVSVIDMTQAVDRIGGWIKRRDSRFVCASDVHGVMRAQQMPEHMAAYRAADMVTPDGMPLRWIGRLRGHTDMQRVCGPDLMIEVCRRSVEDGWRHYFYGGAEGVAEDLAETLQKRFPGLQVAGVECPPFAPQSPAESAAVVKRIADSNADIVWVGLGCPKQELWMHKHVGKIDGAVLIGVGAAFDFHTGRVKRAPVWMQSRGMEWLHRFMAEPARLWRRYLVLAPRFVANAAVEEMRLRWNGGGVR